MHSFTPIPLVRAYNLTLADALFLNCNDYLFLVWNSPRLYQRLVPSFVHIDTHISTDALDRTDNTIILSTLRVLLLSRLITSTSLFIPTLSVTYQSSFVPTLSIPQEAKRSFAPTIFSFATTPLLATSLSCSFTSKTH